MGLLREDNELENKSKHNIEEQINKENTEKLKLVILNFPKYGFLGKKQIEYPDTMWE